MNRQLTLDGEADDVDLDADESELCPACDERGDTTPMFDSDLIRVCRADCPVRTFWTDRPDAQGGDPP